uniref:prolyl oligopeptidase family serine peptidase n=1 Tax=Sphingomonas nostoxanthinifaciens TaxID=2872652 RepID=UPI001CC1CC6F|nr:prolyl oligopeptidase family serine peptidase [Sphingomonas nostoxanthinifaciens]
MTASAAPPPADPYLWLEDINGARPLAWVEAENRRSLGVLESDPRYAGLYADALRIAEATDRIPTPNLIGGEVANFWQDASHVQGVWRMTSPASYRTPTPAWRTLIDLDALSKADGTTWVWHGADCEPVAERRCLVALSAGGEDATTVREFDLATGQFVAGGFTLPTSKQETAWETPDSLLVQRDWGPGTTTASGYGFVVKRVKRGQPLDQAEEVFRGAPTDQLGTYPMTLVDGQGRHATIIWRPLTFFESETYLVTSTGVKKLPLPAKISPSGLVDGRLVFECNQDWSFGGVAVPSGAIVAMPLDALAAGTGTPEILFAPNARQSVGSVGATKDRVVAVVYDNVRGQGWSYAHDGSGWHGTRFALPDNAAVSLVTAERTSDTAFLSVQSITSPPALYEADARAGTATQVKSTPPRFDASQLVTEQYEAISSDGTKIPYFVVHRRDIKLDGSTPTLMTAYGGFQIPMTPAYQAIRGKLWLERGGAYVLANIRGGGEFGPKWHEAGLKTKRQIIYDDFAAVGADLIRRRITSPRRLGIYGGSNGGLLMGVEMTQRPDLWHAVAIQIPLLDMLRFEHLSAGASWVGEYGSMSVPAERAFWEKTSPYQALRPDRDYPEPFIWTTTKDDRVGPVQARKFAARMKEYRRPYLYWENTEGGHGAGANLRQSARAQALEITYFIRKLMDPQEPPSAPIE